MNSSERTLGLKKLNKYQPVCFSFDKLLQNSGLAKVSFVHIKFHFLFDGQEGRGAKKDNLHLCEGGKEKRKAGDLGACFCLGIQVSGFCTFLFPGGNSENRGV